MITTIIDDKDKKKHKIVTQQYQVGTYVIVDHDPAQQFGVNMSEVKYHKHIRKHNNWIPDESSVL